MKWGEACLVLLVYANEGASVHPPCPQVAPRLRRRIDHRADSAWIGPFRPSQEELRWWRETFVVPELPRATDGEPAEAEGCGVDEPRRGLLCRLRQGGYKRWVLGGKDAGVRLSKEALRRSIDLGRVAVLWLSRRWRVRVAYCLVGLYAIRCAKRFAVRVKANTMSGSDVLLDADDRELANRGVVLDMAGQALLIRLRAIGPPDPATWQAPAPGAGGEAAMFESDDWVAVGGTPERDLTRENLGWDNLERTLKRALRLSYTVGQRAKYVDELSDALQQIEEARDEARTAALGSDRALLAEQAVILIQARLCDSSLRCLRDGLIRACADLSALSSFWGDKKSADRRMSTIKSFALGTLAHGQASGRRVAVERDQGNMSASELLLQGYLRSLGGIQTHLQARPKPMVTQTRDLTGGLLTQASMDQLEDWVEDGMYLYRQQLDNVEETVEVTAGPDVGISHDALADLDEPVSSAAERGASGGEDANGGGGVDRESLSNVRGGQCRYPRRRSQNPSRGDNQGPGSRETLPSEHAADRRAKRTSATAAQRHRTMSTSHEEASADGGTAGDTSEAARDGCSLPGRALRRCLSCYRAAAVGVSSAEAHLYSLSGGCSGCDGIHGDGDDEAVGRGESRDAYSDLLVAGGSVVAKVDDREAVRGLVEPVSSPEDDMAGTDDVMHWLTTSSDRRVRDLEGAGDGHEEARDDHLGGLTGFLGEGSMSPQAEGVGGSGMRPIGATGGTTSFVAPTFRERGLKQDHGSTAQEEVINLGDRPESRFETLAVDTGARTEEDVRVGDVGDLDDDDAARAVAGVVTNLSSDATPAGDIKGFWLVRTISSCVAICGGAAAGIARSLSRACGVGLAVLGFPLRVTRGRRRVRAIESGGSTTPSTTSTPLDPATSSASCPAGAGADSRSVLAARTSVASAETDTMGLAANQTGSGEGPAALEDEDAGSRAAGGGVRAQESAWARRISSFWPGAQPRGDQPPTPRVVLPSDDVYWAAQDAVSPTAVPTDFPLSLPAWATPGAHELCAVAHELIFVAVESVVLGTKPTPAVMPPTTPTPSAEMSREPGMVMSAREPSPDDTIAWETTQPAEGVPGRSGHRSRSLVGLYGRSARRGTAGGGAASIARAVRARAAAQAAQVGAAPPPPRRVVRRVLALAMLSVTLRSGRRFAKGWRELSDVGLEAASGLSIFFSDQLWQPCKAIVNKIFFRQRSNLLDPAALEDAETTVQNMLREFLESKRVPESIRNRAVAEADMSLVSRELEKESRSTVRGTISGQIPRILLIQMAFLKNEMLHAIQAIDELFQANQVTLLLISVVPAAIVLAIAVQLMRALLQSATSRRLEPTILVHRAMRVAVRDMERLLTSSRGYVGAQAVSFSASRTETPGWSGHVVDGSWQRKFSGETGPRLDHGTGETGDLWSSRQYHAGDGAGEGVVTAAGSGRNSRGRREEAIVADTQHMMLSEEEAGRLALCLYGLQTTLRQNYYRFESRTRRGLEEDLNDLLRGRPTVSQQMTILGRIQRSYPFLRSEGI